MYKFNEAEMGYAFEQAILQSNILQSCKFNFLNKEIASYQGIPDFVAMRIHNNNIINLGEDNLLSLESSAKVLACLKVYAGRTERYIKNNTDLSDGMLKKVLRELLEYNYIKKQDGLYYLYLYNKVKVDIWAFELKLEDWKRALFQALQYRAFADYSVTVFPSEKENLLKSNIELFDKFNIGVLVFNVKNKKCKWLNRPKKKEPISKWQKLYMLFKLNMLNKKGANL